MSTLITLGYSGSRDGMTKPQLLAVWNYLSYQLLVHDNDPDIKGFAVHHGDCIGGDAEFHVIATVLGCHTTAHPPLNTRLRAWCKADVILSPKDYLPRDWDIVHATAELLAAPKTMFPVPQSGTWTTTGFALKASRPVIVFLPDGSTRSGKDFERELLGGRTVLC